MQRLGNDALAHPGAIGISRVDEVDSELDRSPKYSNRLAAILWLFPNSLAGNSHRAEAEPVDGKVTSDQEFSGVSRRQTFRGSGDAY